MDATFLKKISFYNWYIDTDGIGRALPDDTLSSDGYMCSGLFWDLDGKQIFKLPKNQEYGIIEDEPEVPEWFKAI